MKLPDLKNGSFFSKKRKVKSLKRMVVTEKKKRVPVGMVSKKKVLAIATDILGDPSQLPEVKDDQPKTQPHSILYPNFSHLGSSPTQSFNFFNEVFIDPEKQRLRGVSKMSKMKEQFLKEKIAAETSIQ